MEENRKVIIYIDGNIGSGKTTFIEKLIKTEGFPGNYVSFREPISFWESTGLLEDFYNGSLYAASALQISAIFEKYKNLEWFLNSSRRVAIFDRSFLGDYSFFQANMGNINQHFNFLYHTIYCSYVNRRDKMLASENPLVKEIFIEIDTKPEDCLTRVLQRGRLYESRIGLDYLYKLRGIWDQVKDTYYHQNNRYTIKEFQEETTKEEDFIKNIVSLVRNFI